MKSSFELAMERLGGGFEKLTADQKRQLAEISSIYEAKIAQVRLRTDEDLRKLVDAPEKQDAVRQAFAAEVAKLNEDRDARKTALRRSFNAG
jgi:hypothetical protein